MSQDSQSLVGEPGVAQQVHPFQFTGTGSEYFRIWSVNMLLNILTLWLYSPWAKVRREKFFHQHLILQDSSFDYHANPWTILRGRIIGMVLLAMTLVPWFDGLVALAATLVVYLLAPWMLRSSLRFRLANTSYRSVRFSFLGSTKQTYKLFFALTGPVLLMFGIFFGVMTMLDLNLPDSAGQDSDEAESDDEQESPSNWGELFKRLGGTLGLAAFITAVGAPLLLLPYAHGLWRQFLTNHARFGNLGFAAQFTASQTAASYLVAAGRVLLLLLGIGAVGLLLGFVSGALSGFMIFVGVILFYGTILFFGPYMVGRLQNLWWPLTTLGTHRFNSSLSVRGYLLLQVKNLLLTILTLGLYRPFAAVNNMKMRAEAMSLITQGSLDEVMQNFDGDDQRAAGAESADLVGFDFSL